MTEEVVREMVERIEAYTDSIRGNPEKALAGLVAAGICNPDGTLTPPYADDALFGAW